MQLSQNVARTTVPSYYHIRTNLPQRKPQNQWEGVYYFSGITKRQQHVVLLQRKREREQVLRQYNQRVASLRSQYAQQQQTPLTNLAARVNLSMDLASCGLHTEASACVDAMHQARELRVMDYVNLLRALKASEMGTCVLHSEAGCDPALTFKLLGDQAGEERAAEAYRWYDMAMTALARECGTGVRVETTPAASQLTNALMEALLTCGYVHVRAIPDAVYDRMGARGINPTMSTYDNVLLALSLTGNVTEAEDVFRFVRHRHGEHMTIHSYNALLLGNREAKLFDRCDGLWQELVDRRWPRASPLTSELYLRGVVDHSYAPNSEGLQRFGNVHALEKKKIPIVLAQMDELGIPRTHLSSPLRDEVEDALRKFSIYRGKFYEWGRAVKQFDFIEFRRRHGWMYDLHAMKNTTKILPPVRDPSQPDSTMAAAATTELPAFFSERHPWERPALESILSVSAERERLDDVRAGDIYYDDTKSLHERSSTWMNEVPETRYDQLYGVNHPDVAKIGIRAHLDVEYTNRTEVMERDAALVRKSMRRGRRLRHRVEVSRTHRNEGSLTARDKK
ncbi:putative mitochondrial hypothetical protein [Leptomonas pyrrhocoris]|uniref:Uncharacterized protein n=1 Tax=Leptomonas pyrrhocoris TaxID=157538 RepID=A0A0N0DVG6_LEPPY|nr:putative mitochondrial hypothetical protein [Leptomonas pyrrhocoris]XP_015658762.1 putative mitochondrial hypothetical protein [Leptomonas pyrrhocoris]XP_015658763.1 putative mitochondrial hypothetical protein [Leptomonas pyrrhocoris]XP_015658764.1 putative mitochondrial hypothetical protein [Leptomonas pyrrhocoris]XP_015658765.1 putative mitochondrial hypothetical protein [Leptomonas pyrrhocoris]KPA80322.1 putative mitochondrial hypothetical protein [Leptomonas pyrrhocoris]KPA80323.1 puta|eukprot:XP_015658761.1 putative mitochondrial hypothetical protein [Leptomonas pyrrhocoris]